ncbi:aminotransferase class V-fold PLP-dependent enzyme [Emcibacteraceae bacterium]|nr:aminotransferase class V-fold PLP-dependent enzyme [Emcibacteraceae bacterium]
MIPFSEPTRLKDEYIKLAEAADNKTIYDSTNQLKNYFSQFFPDKSFYFCNSCTDALELACLAIGIMPEDEVIVPDYTFVTSASTFAARGAKIIFADINLDTMCLGREALESLVSPKTKAIVWVDYAGNSMGISEIREFCDEHNLLLIQDSAQSVGNWLVDKNCFLGDFITFSFHSTKNITSGGEGGALILNNPKYQDITDIIFEKGTNRRAFLNGEVDKYTWRELGSSFAGSYTAAFLLNYQIGKVSEITEKRQNTWIAYHEIVTKLKINQKGWLFPAKENMANAHIFWMLAPDKEGAEMFLNTFSNNGVQCTTHYQTLYNSPAGKKYGDCNFSLANSTKATNCLVRLPLFHNITGEDEMIIKEQLELYFD